MSTALPRRSVHRRKEWKQTTSVTFKKLYGDWIYTFHHATTEYAGYFSALTTVRRTKLGDDNPRNLGEMVHLFLWSKAWEEYK